MTIEFWGATKFTNGQLSICRKEHEEHKHTSQHHFRRVLRVRRRGAAQWFRKSLRAFSSFDPEALDGCFLWPFGCDYAAGSFVFFVFFVFFVVAFPILCARRARAFSLLLS
jgi:hypothetical protein